ncbi:MAG: hypothetical protein RQM95_07125 [Syntrophaceticus schinkii]
MKEKRQEQPVIRLVFVGGVGLKTAFQLLAKKVLEERKEEQKQNCAPPSTSE